MTRAKGYMDPALFQKAIDELASTGSGFSGSNVLWLHHFVKAFSIPVSARAYDMPRPQTSAPVYPSILSC